MITIDEGTDILKSDFEEFVKSVKFLTMSRRTFSNNIVLKAEGDISLRDPITFTIQAHLFKSTNVRISVMFVAEERLCNDLYDKIRKLGYPGLEVDIDKAKSYSGYRISVSKFIEDKAELKDLPKFITNLLKIYNSVVKSKKKVKRL